MRLHLTFAVITALLLVITLHSASRHHFTFAEVEQLAQEHAAAKYVPMPDILPPQLRNLTPQQEQEIFWKDDYRLWRKKGLPFQVDFYHISRAFPKAPKINTVDAKGAHRLAYSPSFFNFGDLAFNPPLPTTLGYAGFYLRYPLPVPIAGADKPNVLNGFFSVQGASYFRVLARDQVYGLSARALAINTAVDGKPEEFPEFTQWWLEEPGPDANQVVLDALLDSPSVSGAYEFRIRPGSQTSVDVHASLFFRQSVDRLGLAPFSSMYLFGENAKNHYGDAVHPEIHDSDGILIDNGKGEWVWRPLQQQPFLQLNTFAEENPKGFGLVQRDRNFQHYQDLDNKYNVRPSAWVTPHGSWGKGVIQLIQPPSNNVNTDNVVLFWRPDALPKAGDHLDVDYTIDFYMNDAQRPPLAYCTETFVNFPVPPQTPGSVPAGPPPVPPKTAMPKKVVLAVPLPAPVPVPTPAIAPVPEPPLPNTAVQFLADFAGNGIENIPAGRPPDLDLTSLPDGSSVRDSRVEKNGYDNSWRVTFIAIPAKPHVPTELRCRLMRDGKPLSETWTYTWHE